MINYLQPPGDWKPGIYDLKSYEQYASIPALRSSELKRMKQSAAHYKAAFEYERVISAQLQKSFDKGKAFDLLMLHGTQAIEDAIAIEPDLHRNTKAYKEWRATVEGKLLLDQQEHDFIHAMHERVFSKQRFAEIFGRDGHAHKVLVWQDQQTGLWCKAEIDWITADGIVVDLKSAKRADFWFFSRQAWRLGYHNQGAHYLDGLTTITGIEHSQFMLAVVEVDPPFEGNVFRMGFDLILKGRDENRELMARLAHCLETDSWPGYPDLIFDLESGQAIIEENNEEMEVDDECEF